MDIDYIEQKTKQKIKYFQEIESTHLYAKQIEKEGNVIIIAEEQTKGIGTKGRKWYTGKNKNIAMTIIKHPTCKIEKLEDLTIKVAEGIKETIKELYGYELTIKFPNDLLLNDKKMSGILTEVHTQAGNIKYLLISIGMNVNEDEFDKNIEELATSLKKEYHKDFDRETIIAHVIHKIDRIIEHI